jgi:hypothetical protein
MHLLLFFSFFRFLYYLVVALSTLNINGHSISYGLISRRSVYRAGTRFDDRVENNHFSISCISSRLFIRGIDDDGRVANYVETEQILQLADVACSYVQVNRSSSNNKMNVNCQQYPRTINNDIHFYCSTMLLNHDHFRQ